MIDINKIKLIIWDLDDTLWKGTLSEGGMILPDEHRMLLRDLTDAGIINSICSKNEYSSTVDELKRLEIWNLFVFASINWDNKGARLKSMIEQMALRPINVLFIDDNTFNLQEAKHFLPDLQIAMPDSIPEIIQQTQQLPKKDIEHKRLKQYKILEEKATAAATYDTNEAFLYASNIRVEIHSNCRDIIERLHELIMRSNQLNFTKKRITIDELYAIIDDEQYDCGYVTVEDNYGDYGVVGFYAKIDNTLEHFVFSCRTMGQMIEQYVYAQLDFPQLEVVSEVRTMLNKSDCPGWINQKQNECAPSVENKEISCRILLKGPCDLSNSQSYIRNNQQMVSEFTYVMESTGQVIDTYNHSVHIRGLHEYSKQQNEQIANDCPFVDPNMLDGTFYTGEYDVIFLSSLIESVYPIYQNKDNKTQVVYRSSSDRDKEKAFFEAYEYMGLTTPNQYKQFLEDSLSWLPKTTTLCIILGATLPLDGFEEVAERHFVINDVVKEIATNNSRLRYIDVDEFIHSKNDVTDHINHYQTRVYYDIAQAMIRVINETTGNNVKSVSGRVVYLDTILKYIRKVVKNIITQDTLLYKLLKRIYLRVTRRRDNVQSKS